MDALTIISDLTATSSRNDKEQILSNAFLQGNRDFFVGARLAYDPLITFGVQKVALIEEAEDGEPGTLDFDGFLTLAHKLRTRALTGHAARDAINAAAGSCHIGRWNRFYRLVLLKDLKAGIETKTINKVLIKLSATNPEAREYMIPVFEAQMAHDGRQPQHAKKLRGEKMLDVKLNGVRLLTVLDKDAGTVTQFTGRNGKINERFTEIRGALTGLLDDLPASIVLDSEVVSTSFSDLMTVINRKSEADTSAAKLALFDIIPLSDFRAGICKIPQKERHALLSELATSGLLQKHTGDICWVVPKMTVDLDTEEGREEAARITQEAIAAGYTEAVMYKDPEAPYECGKRSANWLKKKPFIEVSLEIIGFEPGDPEGKFADTLGALVLSGYDQDLGINIRTNCGSGLTDDLRNKIWADPSSYLGLIVEVQADEASLDRDEIAAAAAAGRDPVYSLRFPSFKGFRGHEPGEKI